MAEENKLTANDLSLFYMLEVWKEKRKFDNCKIIIGGILFEEDKVLLNYVDERIFHGSEWISISHIKPYLRLLKDMTDEESIRITKMALDIHAETDMTTISIIPYSDGEIKIKAHYYNTMLESYDDDIVTITDSFDVSHNKHSLSAFNQPQIFQYLIQCQFDIFNWIKSGTALDKTKQNDIKP